MGPREVFSYSKIAFADSSNVGSSMIRFALDCWENRQHGKHVGNHEEEANEFKL
jgi:hypothetical protein